MTNRRQGWGWRRWTLVGVAAAVILMVGGPFLYIHLVSADAPAPLTLASPSIGTSSAAANASASTGTDGTWKVAAGSIVGYRVKEVLFGQSNVAVGRTSRVSGSLAVDGMTISSARFTVDMTSVTSNESRRDAQSNGR